MMMFPGQQDFASNRRNCIPYWVSPLTPLTGGTHMLASNLLRAVFVLAFVVLSGSAYAGHIKPCCPCSATCPSDGSCTCGCGCSDANGKKVCLKTIDADKRQATFTKSTPDGEPIIFPLIDLDVLDGMKPGDCGLISVDEQVVCTGFMKEPQQQQSSMNPMAQH